MNAAFVDYVHAVEQKPAGGRRKKGNGGVAIPMAQTPSATGVGDGDERGKPDAADEPDAQEASGLDDDEDFPGLGFWEDDENADDAGRWFLAIKYQTRDIVAAIDRVAAVSLATLFLARAGCCLLILAVSSGSRTWKFRGLPIALPR